MHCRRWRSRHPALLSLRRQDHKKKKHYEYHTEENRGLAGTDTDRGGFAPAHRCATGRSTSVSLWLRRPAVRHKHTRTQGPSAYTYRGETRSAVRACAEEGTEEEGCQQSEMEVGFLGLGIMGKAMATNLLRHGFRVTVWNRTLAKVLHRNRCARALMFC